MSSQWPALLQPTPRNQGPCDVMRQNPWNAVLCLGHGNGGSGRVEGGSSHAWARTACVPAVCLQPSIASPCVASPRSLAHRFPVQAQSPCGAPTSPRPRYACCATTAPCARWRWTQTGGTWSPPAPTGRQGRRGRRGQARACRLRPGSGAAGCPAGAHAVSTWPCTWMRLAPGHHDDER